MDYTTAPLAFKMRKALRYCRIYGPSRTWVKIKGQYHLKKHYGDLPIPNGPVAGGSVGIIGCGNYSYANVAFYLSKSFGPVLRGCMDIDAHHAASLFEAYGLTYYTTDASRLIHDPAIKLIYIASNHASHAEYAIRALGAGKSVQIEKPHVVNAEQLLALCRAMNDTRGKVFLGFNRPRSRLGMMVQQALHSQTGPAMLNWFVAGHEIPDDHWYFAPGEGGRILGNLCHWTDFVYQMVEPENRYPIHINPTRYDKSDCDIAVTFTFGDGTIAAITFSAKGHTFEGVREVFEGHRGNILISLKDFHSLTIENVANKTNPWQLFRDHGHQRNICNSFIRAFDDSLCGESIRYVWETAELFLKTRESLENRTPLTVRPFDPSFLSQDALPDIPMAGRDRYDL